MADINDHDHDYEALPEDVSPQVHMAAGAAAGVLEHIAMYPLDVVKVRPMRSPQLHAAYC